MKGGSLRFRLLAAAAGSIFIALAFASVGLIVLFERHVERRFAAELQGNLKQLVGTLAVAENGAVAPTTALSEPRFSEPLSGLYWQVSEAGRPPVRSRSLWDAELVLPADDLRDGEAHQHTIHGPGGTSLFAVERVVVLPASTGVRSLRAIVAVDHAEITAARNAFGKDLAPYVALLGVFLVGAAWAQVVIGLRPLNEVRAKLADVRSGRRRMLGPGFPDEVRPLANEVDLLLKAQEAAIEKARSRAADLAHGLRTPLTVLQSDAEELKAKGQPALGDEIADLAQSMRRHVDRELARARAGSRTSVTIAEPLLPAVEGVVGVLRRLPSAANLTFEIDTPRDLALRMDRQDLSEILGNVIENATKWARSRVLITALETAAGGGAITVEDDGPGISEADSAEALSRGGRLDQKHSGTGLGLAIVQDLLEAYGGTLHLARSRFGGLKVEILFGDPSA